MHTRTIIAPIMASILVLALSGCSGKKPGVPYIDTSADFAGPTVEIADADTFTITTPTGGWTLELDQTVRDRYGIRAFATLTRPEDGAMVTTALQPHTLDIPRAHNLPVALYLRTVETDQKNLAKAPYRLAATTTPRP
jgi:hypothetical protein